MTYFYHYYADMANTNKQPTNQQTQLPPKSQVAIKAPCCVIRARPRVVRWSLCYLRRRWHFHFLRSLPPPNLLGIFFFYYYQKKKKSFSQLWINRAPLSHLRMESVPEEGNFPFPCIIFWYKANENWDLCVS